MPFPVPEHALVGLLRQCFTTPRCQASKWTCNYHHSSSKTRPARLNANTSRTLTTTSRPQRCWPTRTERLRASSRHGDKINRTKPLLRTFSESVNLTQHAQNTNKPEKIAVLGGGITGLASAHYLAREKPDASITIYEGSGRLGGWLQSKKIEVENGTVLFEGGPRTLRCNSPAAMATLELVTHLNLQDQILITPKISMAAQNRFIYYPDHLVRMPGPGQDLYSMAWGLLTEPVYKGLFTGVIGEINRPTRPDYLEDESVGSFLERRLGAPHIGNNILSAVLHGIYAGDIYQLSAKSLLPKFWYYETLHGSIVNSIGHTLSTKSNWIPLKDVHLQNELLQKVDTGLTRSLESASIYTFKDGIAALSNAVEAGLRSKSNVQFKINEKITDIKYDGEHGVIRVTNDQKQPPTSYDTIISTLSGQNLSKITSGALPSLAGQHSVTVMVVNLYYRDADLLPERGFGYLIPRSIPYEQNPEFALGVVFDSDSSVGQDTASGTKVTVMLGGHWWDGFDSYPDEAQGVAMAKSILKRHLHVDEEPEAFNVGLHRECIPQYVVGHEASLKAAHHELLSAFKGKLKVAGNSYKGVGLNDCVRSARDVVMDLDTGKSKTGLDEFALPRAWAQTQTQVGN